MLSLNLVLIGGNLTADPESRYSPAGTRVVTFTVAINEKYKKDGVPHEEVSFISVTCFGRTADACAEYLKKGAGAIVHGKLKQERWEDNDKKKHSKTRVYAERVQFINRKRDDGAAAWQE
jgi:single-strand DNA-binding protein